VPSYVEDDLSRGGHEDRMAFPNIRRGDEGIQNGGHGQDSGYRVATAQHGSA
jgi:hypothetical protein